MPESFLNCFLINQLFFFGIYIPECGLRNHCGKSEGKFPRFSKILEVDQLRSKPYWPVIQFGKKGILPFYSPRHCSVFRIFLSLFKKAKPIYLAWDFPLPTFFFSDSKLEKKNIISWALYLSNGRSRKCALKSVAVFPACVSLEPFCILKKTLKCQIIIPFHECIHPVVCEKTSKQESWQIYEKIRQKTFLYMTTKNSVNQKPVKWITVLSCIHIAISIHKHYTPNATPPNK